MEGAYLDRFLSRIVKTDDCWEWEGGHSAAGYSTTWDGTRPLYAHRVAYELWVGPIPDGHTIDHLCRSRGCVNPEHLQAVTQRTNILRGTGQSARNVKVTHCPRGHKYTLANTHISTKGTRECRACWPIRQREARTHCPQGHEYRDGSFKLDKRGHRRCQLCLKSHCPQGHPYDAENTYVSKRGDRHCRACARERARKRSASPN